MNRKCRDIRLPLAREEAHSLRLGEMVTVTGMLFTGRSRYHIRAIEDNIFPPLDYTKINGLLHVGPVMRKSASGAWEIVSIEPTSSIRFERYCADVIEKFKLRTLIGKTTLGPRSVAALKAIGGVYLSKIGLCGNQLRDQVVKIHGVHFLEELGKTEASWVLEVKEFGPFFVAIDAEGGDYFGELEREVDRKLPSIETALGIPSGYTFTKVNAQGRGNV